MGRTMRISLCLIAFCAVGCSKQKPQARHDVAVADSAGLEVRIGKTNGQTLFEDTTLAHVEIAKPVGNLVEWQDRTGKVIAYWNPKTGFHGDSTLYWQVREFAEADQGGPLYIQQSGSHAKRRPHAPKPRPNTYENVWAGYTRPSSWREGVEWAKLNRGELHRDDYAYDAGGIKPRGESDGRFRIQDMQVTYQPAGPFGGVIPDTLLIVAPDRTAPVMPGRFTVVDTVFEETRRDPPFDPATGIDAAAYTQTDTALIVRPH